MDEVELPRETEGSFQHDDERCIAMEYTGVQAKGLRADRFEPSSCRRVTTGKERHVMAQANQFFGQIGHDPLRPSITLGRDAFRQGSDLSSSHCRSLLATPWRYA